MSYSMETGAGEQEAVFDEDEDAFIINLSEGRARRSEDLTSTCLMLMAMNFKFAEESEFFFWLANQVGARLAGLLVSRALSFDAS